MGPYPRRHYRALVRDAPCHPPAGGGAATTAIPPSQLSPAPGNLAAILSASSAEPAGKLGRMIQNPQLRIPGRTPVAAHALQDMDAPMNNHRRSEFRTLHP